MSIMLEIKPLKLRAKLYVICKCNPKTRYEIVLKSINFWIRSSVVYPSVSYLLFFVYCIPLYGSEFVEHVPQILLSRIIPLFLTTF